MEARAKYKPFWRINRSVLPLGITWEEALPSLCLFLFLKLFLEDFLIALILSLSQLILAAHLKRVHRSKASLDLVNRWFMGDHIYVEKSRSFKFD
jgi:hypothetical protein